MHSHRKPLSLIIRLGLPTAAESERQLSRGSFCTWPAHSGFPPAAFAGSCWW